MHRLVVHVVLSKHKWVCQHLKPNSLLRRSFHICLTYDACFIAGNVPTHKIPLLLNPLCVMQT